MKALWKGMAGLALLAVAAALAWAPAGKMPVKAASHREAPLIAQDPTADITDWFAFVSYDNTDKVTMIMNVIPFEEPSLGPNYFNFGDDVLYSFKVDNDRDGVEDVYFEFQFKTEFRAPGVFLGLIGVGNGVNAPANSPPPVAPGTPLIPPAITALDGPGSEGFNQRQSYTVTMVKGGTRTVLNPNKTLYAVPSYSGPRTMPDYAKLVSQGIYDLGNGIRVFAGQRDDGFYIDLGGTFDTLNLRRTPVLTDAEDADDTKNPFGVDHIAGFNVNSIAIEVPISMLTKSGTKPSSTTDAAAVIGTWGYTARQLVTVRPTGGRPVNFGRWKQVQRMGNPLINETIIGIGSKDAWSQDEPKNDSAYASFGLDPILARAMNAAFGLDIPTPPRNDLAAVLFQYPGVVGAATPAGPIADLLRLNVAVPPTAAASRKRLGVLAADNAGWPNGRRVSDDVTDIALRAVAGVLVQGFNKSPNNRLGDGVNTNDKPYLETFPYQAAPHSGRDRSHAAGEPK